jgi:glycosyltransferase involved in cell wall biosynthesis
LESNKPMRKVLIITYYWPPAGGGGVQRWLKFVKYLRSFGWEPIVYTVENGDYPFTDLSFKDELPSDLEVIKQPIWEPYTLFRKLRGIKKNDKIDPGILSQNKKYGFKEKLAVWIRGNFFIPDARCFWIKPSIKFLTKFLKENKVDVIVSTGPPHSCNLIGLGVQKKTRLPWIADFRDEWTQIDFFENLGLTKPARKKHLALEKKVLDNADIILTVGSHLAYGLKSLSLKPNRIEVISNGFDEQDRHDVNVPLDNKFTIVYIGAMNEARNPKTLWFAIKMLKETEPDLLNDLEIRIIGKLDDDVLRSVQEMGISDKLNYVGYVSHAEAVKYQNSAQMLLLVINKTKNNKAIVTGKIFEYIAAGRPIICIGPKDGDAAEIIKKSNTGWVFDYDEIKELASHIKKNYELYKINRLKVNASEIENYSRKNLTEKLANLLNELRQV